MAVLIARIFVASNVACSYGMLTFVSRTCLQSLMLAPGKAFSFNQKTVVTFLYVAATMGLAIVVPTLSTALSAAGVLVVIIDLVFPGFMLLKSARTGGERFGGWFSVIFGGVIGVISIVVTLKPFLFPNLD